MTLSIKALSPFVRDTLERAVWTFIEGFTVVILAAGVLNVTVIQAAALAGGMAVLAFIKAFAAVKLGSETPQLGPDTYHY